jgi:hypothetical protein
LGTLVPYWTMLHRSSFRLRVRSGEFEDLTTFHLSNKEYENLNWTEKHREFMKEGKMYDIKSIEETDSGYTLLCKYDKAESLVAKLLSNQKEKDKAPDHSSSKKRVKSDPSQKYFPTKALTAAILRFGLKPIKFENQISKLTKIYFDIESPPPESPLFI